MQKLQLYGINKNRVLFILTRYFGRGCAVNEQKMSLRSRTYYYVQPADKMTDIFIRVALPKKPVTRGAGEGVGAPISSSHDLYRVEWKDVEFFMQNAYIHFNVFARNSNETLPHFVMRKSFEIEERNKAAKVPGKRPLALIAKKKIKAKTVLKREEAGKKTASKKTWMTYVIFPEDDKSSHITVLHIRKALMESGLSTQSVRESDQFGEFDEDRYEHVWEASGDALFRLWRYARKNPLIHFGVFRSLGGEEFEDFFSYPKNEGSEKNKGKVLQYCRE